MVEKDIKSKGRFVVIHGMWNLFQAAEFSSFGIDFRPLSVSLRRRNNGEAEVWNALESVSSAYSIGG